MRLWILAIAAVVALSACGKSEQQKQAEQAADDLKKAAETMAKAAEKQGTAAAAQGANDMAKAMQTMASAFSGGADGKAVDPIAFQTLQSHLPKVSGWEMDEPEGERMTMPVAFSQVETKYKKGETRIDAKIVDTGFAQLLMAPWSMMMAAGYSRESSSGYEKSTSLSGNPAIEKWNKSSKNGELDVLVGKRFMLSLEGHDLEDIKQLQDFASNFNLSAIAAAK